MTVDSPEDLYGLPLTSFIPERGAVVKALRTEKRREEAAGGAAMRKPSVAAWAVNQLVRIHSETIRALFDAGIEVTTKSGQVRRVPLADQPAAALDRLSRRRDFSSADDYVICNALGRPLDDSALRRRYKNARDAAGLRPLRWHDLRHTFGSLLVASGVDLVSIKDAMGTPS